MSSETLTSDEVIIARNTKRAIEAAGGLQVCAGETGKSTTHLSRCSSTDHRDSLTLRDAIEIDALGKRADDRHHILRAWARLAGGVFVSLPQVDCGPDSLMRSASEITIELGQCMQKLTEGLSSSSHGGSALTKREAVSTLDELDDVDRASARLRRLLMQVIDESGNAKTKTGTD